jgi:16S rRNA processing protein RimM
MATNPPEFLAVGFVSKPHGIKGEAYVQPLTDYPESVFVPGVVLRSSVSEGQAPDEDAPPLRIENCRPFQKGYLVRFTGASDRNDAERFRGLYLLRALAELAPLAEGEVFYHDLIGMKVETVDGVRVGRIREVYEMQPADLLEVATPRGKLLVPFVATVVVDVRPAEGLLVIDPPDGLLEL